MQDVDTIIKDLVDVAINLQRTKMKENLKQEVNLAVENRILDILAGDAAQSSTRESFRQLLQEGALDDRTIEVDLPVSSGPKGNMPNDGKGGIQFGDFILKMDNMMGSKTQTKKMKIRWDLADESRQKKDPHIPPPVDSLSSYSPSCVRPRH